MSLEILFLPEIQGIPFLLHFLEYLLLHLHQAFPEDPLVPSAQHHPLALDLLHHQEVLVVQKVLVTHSAQVVPLFLLLPEHRALVPGVPFCQQILQPYVKPTHLREEVQEVLALLGVLEYQALHHNQGDL